MPLKPIKKTDKELFSLIEEKIRQGQYVFLKHAKQRLKERNINELDVIYLLSGKKGYGRKRNKVKDSYEALLSPDLAQDWKYCIEGYDIDGHKLRVIITFTDDLMPIITVIRIGQGEIE
ncbi:DUF4258 domain-containing protein [Legionella sp. CNM-1927-20]|uniref:DUF4258 domain-containing protein n=1 Tax=Legionella sp. CNM-1927-20 TaxID=3422221 RepID=UPI00403B239F